MNPSEQIWQTFRTRLRAFVRSRVADADAADDVLQAAFLRMHRSLTQGKSLEDPQAWMYAITRNAIIDHYRAVGARVRLEAGDSSVSASADLAVVNLPEPGDASIELTACVGPLLQQLEEPYRTALRLTAIEGQTQEAAARTVGISVSGMKSRVQRARLKLRGVFETCCAIELDVRGHPISARAKSDCACAPQQPQDNPNDM